MKEKKVKEKKVNANSNNGNKTLIKVIVSLGMAILLFVALVSLEGSILKNYEKGTAVVAKSDMTQKTMITDENKNKYFEETQIEKALISKNTIVSIDDVVGKVATTDIDKGQVANDNLLRDASEGLDKIQDPAEVSFAVSSLVNSVAGQVRSGDLVDISVYNNATLKTEYIKRNVYVKEALTTDGVKIANNDTDSLATSFVVVIEKSESNQFIADLNKGPVYVTYPQAQNPDEILKSQENTENVVENENTEVNADSQTINTDETLSGE